MYTSFEGLAITFLIFELLILWRWAEFFFSCLFVKLMTLLQMVREDCTQQKQKRTVPGTWQFFLREKVHSFKILIVENNIYHFFKNQNLEFWCHSLCSVLLLYFIYCKSICFSLFHEGGTVQIGNPFSCCFYTYLQSYCWLVWKIITKITKPLAAFVTSSDARPIFLAQ